MQLQGRTALVTGVGAGNLGHHFVQQLLERGAARVYATARRPENIDAPGAEVLRLDMTHQESVTEAAAVAHGVDLLINNASVAFPGLTFLGGDPEMIRRQFDTNVFGTLAMIRAFAPVLAANGGGAILNVLSAAAWSATEGLGVYGASKAALWSMTANLRGELSRQGTFVSSLVFGMASTPVMKALVDSVAGPGALDDLMTDPAVIVARALDGLEAGSIEIVADTLAVDAKAALTGDGKSAYGSLSDDYSIPQPTSAVPGEL
ncbi:short-chain dehydrogenase [Actinoplanes sp. NBRC 14428]|uniref:Short-subunit dehydrogenase n=1 Tax=Pseudosporangium ferrugineum TaxID=439699 RepID=A0A2T0SBS1_9ACTN|nr:SDR family NAD(P)-dependent oxidoreductase [Pseudosporangium ferrugineum]PRY30875.1 short-subunit dehydrogenase [Pseudosporangium ferrugineum]BCJ50389.1 short-chain dehydrogenase [Actinoplanes sp. NBRC 14428]